MQENFEILQIMPAYFYFLRLQSLASTIVKPDI